MFCSKTFSCRLLGIVITSMIFLYSAPCWWFGIHVQSFKSTATTTTVINHTYRLPCFRFSDKPSRKRISFHHSKTSHCVLYATKDPNNNYLDAIKKTTKKATEILTKNPLFKTLDVVYSYFYWTPRQGLPYEYPWTLFTNTTAEWLAWYQIPHNLPPYRFLGRDHPPGFFCWGLPGNTLPLGNWDPWGLQLVTPSVVRKYRESELKHGRLAMLATVAILVQEWVHPLHPTIGGLAITHMDQLQEATDQSFIFRFLLQPVLQTAGVKIGNMDIPLDYIAVWSFLLFFEIKALLRNWTRWKRDEYYHPFDHNLGVGNLQENYENGNYGFDPLNLMPDNAEDRRDMIERELNHCRLAMVAAIGMIGQEYFTGLPVYMALERWLDGSSSADMMMINGGIMSFDGIAASSSNSDSVIANSMETITSALKSVISPENVDVIISTLQQVVNGYSQLVNDILSQLNAVPPT